MDWETGCPLISPLERGCPLKSRAIVKSPQMSSGTWSSWTTSQFNCWFLRRTTPICKFNRALLPNMQRNALVNGRTSLLGASRLGFRTFCPGDDGAFENWRHLGFIGAFEKHSSCIGASGLMLTAAYDIECTGPRTASISFKTSGCCEGLISALVGVPTSSTMESLVWIIIFFDHLTLTHAFIPFATEYSECTLLILNPLLLLKFYATIICGAITFFLNPLDGIPQIPKTPYVSCKCS